MSKFLAFSESSYTGTNQKFHNNDPDLMHNAIILENGGPDSAVPTMTTSTWAVRRRFM